MFTCYDANSSPSEDGTSEYAVLPVVYIKNGVTMTKDANDVWQLSE